MQLIEGGGDVEIALNTKPLSEPCLRIFVDAGADEIMFIHQMGSVPHDAIVETIHNIGKHVIPHFNR